LLPISLESEAGEEGRGRRGGEGSVGSKKRSLGRKRVDGGRTREESNSRGSNRDKGMITTLLRAKANVNLASGIGGTPLHYAFASAPSSIDANFSLEKMLIDAGI
jgi:hypothetical protein